MKEKEFECENCGGALPTSFKKCLCGATNPNWQDAADAQPSAVPEDIVLDEHSKRQKMLSLARQLFYSIESPTMEQTLAYEALCDIIEWTTITPSSSADTTNYNHVGS